jgi:hypothetical protein
VDFAGHILPELTSGVHHPPFPSGSGTLATITFKVISQPTSTVPNAGACDFVLYPARLVDVNVNILRTVSLSCKGGQRNFLNQHNRKQRNGHHAACWFPVQTLLQQNAT